jgi:tetrahydromethanopterin S-methyltransferase subunit G
LDRLADIELIADATTAAANAVADIFPRLDGERALRAKAAGFFGSLVHPNVAARVKKAPNTILNADEQKKINSLLENLRERLPELKKDLIKNSKEINRHIKLLKDIVSRLTGYSDHHVLQLIIRERLTSLLTIIVPIRRGH